MDIYSRMRDLVVLWSLPWPVDQPASRDSRQYFSTHQCSHWDLARGLSMHRSLLQVLRLVMRSRRRIGPSACFTIASVSVGWDTDCCDPST